jgi:hypothetical protein
VKSTAFQDQKKELWAVAKRATPCSALLHPQRPIFILYPHSYFLREEETDCTPVLHPSILYVKGRRNQEECRDWLLMCPNGHQEWASMETLAFPGYLPHFWAMN